MREWQVAHLVGHSGHYAPDLQNWGPLVVPPDSFFALGDNRDASYDCRYYGFIPSSNVIGRASVIYWSFDPGSAGSLGSRVRWERIGQRLSSAAQ
jgi:signal peptidase I